MGKFQVVEILRQVTNKTVDVSTSEPKMIDLILEKLTSMGLEFRTGNEYEMPGINGHFTIQIELKQRMTDKGEGLKWLITRMLCEDGWEPFVIDPAQTYFKKRID